MSTSDKTFSQVKAILGKLDQRIDSLRERRTAPTVTSGNTHAPTTMVAHKGADAILRAQR